MNTRSKLLRAVLTAMAPLACAAQSMAVVRELEKATALTPDLENGEHRYLQYCVACHHRSGWGSGPREVPTLAGQQELYLLEQLIRFSMLDRIKEEMHAVVIEPAVTSPQTLRDISAYIAGSPLNPEPEHGDGTRLAAGARIYTRACVACHEKDGAGNPADLIPAIGGQQYRYLLVRLNDFSRRHGSQEQSSMEPAVVNRLARLSPEDRKAVADYISRLPALHAK